MNSMIIVSAIFLALFAIIFTSYNPQNFFSPVPIPGSKNSLHAAKLLDLTGAVGPESLVFDSNGDGPYTGVADGRILKWEGEERGWTEFAVTSSNRSDCVRPFAPELEHVCGRPLGLKFDKKNGDLYMADAYLGLNVVGPAGGLATQVATEAEGLPFHFTNDLDISEDEDVIYFTDSSSVYQRRQHMLVTLSGDKTGRLMKYDKSSKEVKVLLSGLFFPNGVALSKDGSFLLVAETSISRILRLWLNGPNVGQIDTFAVLPGFPDNIRRNSEGHFWVALHSKKTPFTKWISSNLWARKALLKLRNFKRLQALLATKPHAAAIKLSDEGEIIESLEDREGKTLKFISEVEEKDGKLWMASVLMPYIGVYSL
ncbi:putative strictosidine synthase transcription factor WD40-like family [Medicago truncatula]|uniref:Putative strictosidine synthase transcription factor WD40-like family n=1 Tax=Medicago truncatula TaxID=3880 RepID=G7KRN9_MEDTR|nr:protein STRICTOSIDINE SYNTHASE-LIKE 10 [Medicago truncatula]AES81258.2 strictosidine synthase family protein [Medicago truncatula]RHN47768.1 putative strictosidine synthase transcription factor WD40-like family [Medicago truncatula]